MMDQTIIGGPFVRYLPDAGTVFMVTEEINGKAFVRAFCLRLIQDRWGSFTIGAFRRCGCDALHDYWIERIDEEVVVLETMTVYQVPIERWMSQGEDGHVPD